MRVLYNVGVDGWTEYVGAAPDGIRHGPFSIGDAAWRALSVNGVIPCKIDLTDTGHLLREAGKF